jgi:hypothetical protein
MARPAKLTAKARAQIRSPNAAAILGTEHWSLLAARSLIWNEAQSRATVFLTVLSASIIALALLADATGFGAQTTTLALVLLPVVLLLGIATYGRLVQINTEEFQLVAGHEPATARLLDHRAGPGALLHHRPPRRRAGPGDHLHAGSPHPGAAVAALPGQHPDHRGDRGRGPGGHLRAAPAGRRGADGCGGGRWGDGVPGGLGNAVSPAAARSAPLRATSRLVAASLPGPPMVAVTTTSLELA